VAEVRIVPPARLASSAPASGRRVFAQRVGGLAILARSQAWNRLSASTRVFVAVSTVAGADPSVREVAFFVLRRRLGGTRGPAARGEVTFSIANARPVLGSFWVRGVDRRGFADVFEVRNMLATALANWSRYLAALRTAHALIAALHPLMLGSGPADAAHGARARHRRAFLWTGGQRPSRRDRALFRLLADAVSDPLRYTQAKRNPLIVEFISRELNNPSLARRWRAVTGVLPLHVPDRYAAAAHEEALFAHVSPPRITRGLVAIPDGPNSAEENAKILAANATTLTVHLLGSTGPLPGRVTGSTFVYGQNIDCPPPDLSTPCTASFLTGQTWETLRAIPSPGWQLFAWHGCDQIIAGDCRVLVGGANRDVGAEFHLLVGTLLLIVDSHAPMSFSGPGTVTVQPGGESCRASCVFQFSAGEHLTLTATPNPGASFTGWSGNDKVQGCESTIGNTCRTTMPPGFQVFVRAFFDGPVVSLRKAGTGTGAVTSNPAGIDCPASCPGEDGFFASVGEAVALTATPAPGSAFVGWSGCDSATANTCATTARADTSRALTARFTAEPGFTMIRIAGNGSMCRDAPGCGDNGAATRAQLADPAGVAVDHAGNLYIADTSDQEIRKVGPDGTITRVAGDGTTCATAGCGDGGPAVDAQLDNPQSVAVDGTGDLYIADTDDEEVRKVAPNGTITTIAGRLGLFCEHPPDCGDGGLATRAFLSQPLGVAVDNGGDIYIADAGDNELRKVTPDGTITRVAGTGAACPTAPACGDGGPAISATLSTPSGVAVDSGGDVYIADAGDEEVRKLAPDGTITRIAGNGTACRTEPTCTHGPDATQAQLSSPTAVAVAPQGGSSATVYIADTGDNLVWAVDSTGVIDRVAGNGLRCQGPPDCGDGGGSTDAQLAFPQGIAADADGNLDIADTFDNEIRQAHLRRPL
jgi:sugar lactone lactonase YvrE